MTWLTADSEEFALEKLHKLGCTDGLPVIVPSEDRVDRMVLASGFDADYVLGQMGPAFGIATIEKVATAAVMAGCLPDYMPVVVAAVKAILDPAFDLAEMQSTTHCTAPLIIVNGPARSDCGPIASGFGALGPGHRANATIGRALRLAMINIGGGRPGISDMALLGHPGKFTFCLAEDEESSPFRAMHVDRGFMPTDSVVTVIGAEAPHSVLHSVDADNPEDHQRLLELLAIGLTNLATNNAILRNGSAVVILNPDHAQVFSRVGMDRLSIVEELLELCRHPREDIARYGSAFMNWSRDDKDFGCFRDVEQIILITAGGNGLYSAVMPTWCAGAHRNPAVSVLIEKDQFCEIP